MLDKILDKFVSLFETKQDLTKPKTITVNGEKTTISYLSSEDSLVEERKLRQKHKLTP